VVDVVVHATALPLLILLINLTLFCCVTGSSLPALTDLSSFPSSAGVVFLGGTSSQTGFTVGPGGDFNGDGLQDFIISSRASSPNNRATAGEVFVVFGSASLPSSVNLTAFSASQGVRIIGANASDALAGIRVNSAGDFNKDGFGDIILGFPNGTPYGRKYEGYAVIIFGGKTVSGTIDLLTLTPSQGILIAGKSFGAFTGTAVSGVGDVNGDNYPDVVIGARYLDEAYVLFGSASFPPVIDLIYCTTYFAPYCTLIKGPSNTAFGESASAAGDVNGDGISDFMIGAFASYSVVGGPVGQLSEFYGQKPFPAVIDIGITVNFGGVIIQGNTQEELSVGMSPAGDMNKDGFDDILVTLVNVGAPDQWNATAMYLIYGGNNLPQFSNITSYPTAVAFLGATGGFVDRPVSGNYDIDQDGK